jgi:hypothetical protein
MQPQQPVRPALRDLLHHVLVLATALAVNGDVHPRRVAALVRGLSVQLAFRTITRQALVIPGRAVLLWSVVGIGHDPKVSRGRVALAALVATGLGTAVTGFPMVLLLPMEIGIDLLGASEQLATLVVVGAAACSLLLMGHGAVVAFRAERRRARRMTADDQAPVWRLDLLGALDSGQGHGGRLLDAFLDRADHAGAHVFLVTQPVNVGFYARHGLQVLSPAEPDGMIIMRRLAGASRPISTPLPSRAARRHPRSSGTRRHRTRAGGSR